MGGQLGRIPSIPGYLVFWTLCLRGGMYGGTTREDPEYPGILSILDTVCSAPKIHVYTCRLWLGIEPWSSYNISRDSRDIPGSPGISRDLLWQHMTSLTYFSHGKL